MESVKKNISLIFGIAIPILMIIFVAGSIYLPGLFIKPRVNFLYSSGDYYNNQDYGIENNRLVKFQNGNNGPSYALPKLFVYDVVKNESKEISFNDAQNLSLDPNGISSDGFEVVYGSRGDSFFPFFFYSGRDYNTRYLQGHNVSKKLNIQLSGSYNGFRFLGWIK